MVDVNTVPPHPPVVQKGALRVQLRLANGVCTAKSCFDGKHTWLLNIVALEVEP